MSQPISARAWYLVYSIFDKFQLIMKRSVFARHLEIYVVLEYMAREMAIFWKVLFCITELQFTIHTALQNSKCFL